MSLDNLLNRVVTIKGYSGNYLKNHGTHVSFTNMERSLATQWVIYRPDPSKDDIFIKCLANGKNLQIVANGDAYVTNTNELLWEAFHIESDASGHVFFVSHHTGNVLRIGDRGGRACAYNANRLEWERMLVEPVNPDPKDLILMQTSFPGLFKQVIKAVSPDAQIYLDMICNILCCTHSGTEMDSLVVSMVSRFPETLEMRCADGNLAFHVALEFKGSEEVVLAIFNANSKASQEKSVKGDHPLHQAIRKKHSEKVVLNIFKSYKKASQKESADGELPLHRAIQNDYSDHIVLKILAAYPCAAMIRCKKSGMLPLHLAAASSASPRLVEALISEYPEALQIAVNNTIPRDLVSAALPMESIKLICRPSLHCNIMPSKQQDKVNIERAKESGNAESLKQVATEVLDMSKIIEGLSKDILKLNTTVEALQRRLDGLDSKYFVPQNISTELLGESLGALRVPFPAEHSVTTAHKPPMLKLDSTEEITEKEKVLFHSTEPPSLAAVVEASNTSCHVASTLQTPTPAPLLSGFFELNGSLVNPEAQMQLDEKQTLLTSETMLEYQRSVDFDDTEIGLVNVADIYVSKCSNSSKQSDLVDKGSVEQIMDTNSNNELESYEAIDETLSLSICSAGSFSFVDDNTNADSSNQLSNAIGKA